MNGLLTNGEGGGTETKLLGHFFHASVVESEFDEVKNEKNKAGYTASPVACGWAGAIIEVSGAFGQEQ